MTAAFARLNEIADVLAPWAIRVAATLRLPDHIARGDADLASLADRTGVSADRLARLMRYLTVRDIFASPAQGRYALTPLSELLCDGAPGGMRDFMDLDGAVCRLERVAVHLIDAIRDDAPAYRVVYGRDAWEDLATDPALAESFDAAMSHKSALMAPGIVAAFDWGSVRTVVDVGGGTGVILAEILLAAPNLRATLLDRPGTGTAGRRLLERAGVADRATVVGADFFDPLPAGADLYLMVNLLHEWDDPEAEAILRCCAEAAGSHGRVMIGEFLVDACGVRRRREGTDAGTTPRTADAGVVPVRAGR